MNLKENDSFFTHHFRNFENTWMISILFYYTKNWISDIGIGYITPKIIVYLENWYDFTKNILNVSASSSLFVIVYYIILRSCFIAFSMEILFGEKKIYSFPKVSIISNNFVI